MCLQAYLNVAFDSAELRALNAANIDCDITFMQVGCLLCACHVAGLRVILSLSQFLECLVAVASKMEKSDVVSLAIKVQPLWQYYCPLQSSTHAQVEALMRALTGEKGGSRPSTRQSKASDGAAGEGKGRASAVRNHNEV